MKMMWCLLALFGMAVSAVVGGEYPPSVRNVSNLFSLQDPWKGSVCPLINMKNYLHTLADHVAKPQPVYSLIVVGTKSSGKSKGISRMIVEWKKLGYTILDIDLKGEEYNVTSKQVLGQVSKEIYKIFEGPGFYCLSEFVHQNCSVVQSEGYFDWLNKQLSELLTIGNGVVTVVISFITVGASYLCFGWTGFSMRDIVKRIFAAITICFILFSCLVTVWWLFGGGKVREYFLPLNSGISSGDWETLLCTCNGITICMPDRRPIVIVREFENFNEDSLDGLLRSLEPMKQEKLMFPVILETSDFFWRNRRPVIKSSYSFKSYFLEEMTFKEGVEQLVNQYKMWELEDFKKIYEALGGHTGSYAMLWNEIKDGHQTVDNAISLMRNRAYDNLLSCMDHVGSKADRASTKLFFCKLRENNYKLLVKEVLKHPVWYLLKCNILFRKNKLVYPQNDLLKHGIELYIEDFVNNCTNVSFE